MLFAAIGDMHGAFDALDAAIAREPHARFWLCVGDVGDDAGRYPSPARPFYFIKGNNEDFGVIARLAEGETIAEHLHLVPNGRLVTIEGVRVAGLGGTYAPTWYETAPEALPAATRGGDLSRSGAAARADLSRRSGTAARADLSRRSGAAAKADRRRHFVRAEVDAIRTLGAVDVFLSHEAPRPYWVGTGRRRNDAGKTVINEILAAVKPRLHLFGHHHRFSETKHDGLPSVGLPLASEGYLVVDTDHWTWQLRTS